MKPQNMLLINLTKDEAKLIQKLLAGSIWSGVDMTTAKSAVRIFDQIERQL